MKKRKKLTKRKLKWIERTVANDRSYKAIVYNRFIVCALAALLQAFILVGSLTVFNSFGWAVSLVSGLFAIFFVLYIISRNDYRPAKISWIILILAFPLVGTAVYFLYGNGNTTKRMQKRYAEAKQSMGVLKQDETVLAAAKEEGRSGQLCSYLSKAGAPVYADGDVTYYSTGKEMFAAMKAEMEKAEKFILVEFFIIAGGKMWKETLEILLKKAMQGVKVKIIYDDFGSIFVLPPHYAHYLDTIHENVECFSFNRVSPIFSMQMNHRDHRKMLVVDGRVAFTGGVNIADEYIDEKERFGYWKDTGIKVTGSAVRSFTYEFFNTWKAFKNKDTDASEYLAASVPSAKKGGYIQPYADGPVERERVGETVYLDIIYRAKDYLYITTPYLVLDDMLRLALIAAAERGVDVRIVTPGIPDKKTVFRLTRANYKALLKAGVRIYEYTPGFIHAKSVVSDGFAVVGTINFDYRSLYHHFENAVYFSDESAVEGVKKDIEETVLVSKEQTVETSKRNIFGKIFDAILRLIEPLM